MSSVASVLQSSHLPFSAFEQQSDQWKSKVLGVICFSGFSTHENAGEMAELPFIRVPMPIIKGEDSSCEVWRSSALLMQGQRGAIRYRCDDETLFGVIVMPEVSVEESGQAETGATPLQHATESAYRQIFALLDELDYPFVFRFWNYMADINGSSHGLERYRQFNLGRQNAFLACGREVMGNVPAACALGSAQGPLTIAFLVGRTPPLAIENPRQISAYQYPQRYGPRSPSFSRASLVRLGQDEVLFVSGTASIVGHETLHPADVVAQTRETLVNIKAVISEANRQASQPKFDLGSLFYRVYVRHVADMSAIRSEMERAIGAAFKVIFLQADICREDLLLEIEATAGHPFEFLHLDQDQP